MRAARGRKESSRLAICSWSGQTRAIGVPLSTATSGSAAGYPAAARSSAQASNDVVERFAVRPRAPLGGAVGLGVAPLLGDAEGEDDRGRLLLAEAERGANRVAVGEPIRAGSETLVPGGEEHVLRGTAGVERDGPLSRHDDRDDQPCAENVARCVDTGGERLDSLAALDHEKGPRLPV